MENVAEALKMAGAVMLFVLALSIIIFYFGEVRLVSDTILNYKDRETVYIDGDLYYKTSGTERIVSLETIIPSIFRAYLENYKIVFEGIDENKPIYIIKDGNGDDINKFCLDLETKQRVTLPDGTERTDFRNVVLADDEQKAEFLRVILYRDFNVGMDTDKFQKKYGIELGPEPLYEQLKSATQITEYLGIYYQDDNTDKPEIMKTEKRIITYKIEY